MTTNKKKKHLLIAAHKLCSSLLPAARHLTGSALSAIDMLIHPELSLVAKLGTPRPRPAQGGEQITERRLSSMSDPETIYLFR